MTGRHDINLNTLTDETISNASILFAFFDFA